MNIVRYGTVTVKTIYFDHQLRGTSSQYNESIKVEDGKDALAEYLKLLDQYQAGEITEFGIHCYTDKAGKLSRAEKTWTIPDLS